MSVHGNASRAAIQLFSNRGRILEWCAMEDYYHFWPLRNLEQRRLKFQQKRLGRVFATIVAKL